MTTHSFTRDALGIFWDGEEVPGITLYGLWPNVVKPEEPRFPEDAWPSETEWRASWLFGLGWWVHIWDIRIAVWPTSAAWMDVVCTALQALRAGGATVAWGGLEGRFADPPSLFDPAEMSEGVWIAVDVEGNTYGPPHLDAPFTTVSDATLLLLRSQTAVDRLKP